MMRLFLLIVFALMLTHCAAPRALNEQLILFFEPQTISESLKQPEKGYPYRVLIKDLDLERVYDNANVVMRVSDWTVSQAKRGTWAVRPNTSASDLLEAVLKANLRCRALKDRFTESNPDYVIGGTLSVVEEDVRKANVRAARLSVVLRISRYSDEKVIFEKAYNSSSALTDSGYVGFARALSIGLQGACNEFVSDAIQTFNKELQAGDAQNDRKD